MKKEWFTAKELAGIPGLPKSPQGVNLKARNNKWQSRKKEGIQGKAVEYHIDSFPEHIQYMLVSRESYPQYIPANAVSSNMLQADPFAVWVSAYHQLTIKEREKIVALIMRIGVDGLIRLIKQLDVEKIE